MNVFTACFLENPRELVKDPEIKVLLEYKIQFFGFLINIEKK